MKMNLDGPYKGVFLAKKTTFTTKSEAIKLFKSS